LRVAFAGTPEFALPALAALCAQHELVGVLTQPDRPQGRGRKLKASAVKAAALARNLPLAQPETLNSEAARAALHGWAPEALIVVAYGLRLPRAILALPRYGCLNIHASLLPRWRGAAPIQRAILAGDRETGVTIMQMDEGLDTGAILGRRALPIAAADTGGSVHDALARLGATALLATLAGIAGGRITPVPQPQEGVTYAPKIEKTEARINWSHDAAAIGRQVRAFNPWPVAETTLEGEQLRIHAAHPADETSVNVLRTAAKNDKHGVIIAVQDDAMLVRCGHGVLTVTQVQQPGRKRVSVRDFSHSHSLLGRRLG
jgi:methionyl-tRNA formyltransferase